LKKKLIGQPHATLVLGDFWSGCAHATHKEKIVLIIHIKLKLGLLLLLLLLFLQCLLLGKMRMAKVNKYNIWGPISSIYG